MASFRLPTRLLLIGRSSFDFVRTGMDMYVGRLRRYGGCEVVEIPDVKAGAKADARRVMELEARALDKHLRTGAHVLLLDENGARRDSVGFARHLESLAVRGTSRVDLVIGGAYGFDPAFKARVRDRLSLSPMTVSHQLVRLVVLEQLYRAMTILNHEPYHHA